MLALINWRYSFLVYAFGLLSMILVFIHLPKTKLGKNSNQDSEKVTKFKKYPFVISMFLLMGTFFIYPTNFALISIEDNLIPQTWIPTLMAFVDLLAFFMGIYFVKIKKRLENTITVIVPILFIIAYLLLFINYSSSVIVILGSALIGIATGLGIPVIYSESSKIAGRFAVTIIMPLISVALYSGQFLTPFLVNGMNFVVKNNYHAPYILGIILSIVLLWSYRELVKTVKRKEAIN